MSKANSQPNIESYRFHHIDINKCKQCRDFSCEEACFRGIYKVLNKETEPRSIVIEEREDRCVKCHICTTTCKLRAITID
ncbi:MAG: hypothetical protein ACFFBH_12350 [Promethearchaeota archaeon]